MVFFEASEFHLIWLPFLVGEDRENSLNVETEWRTHSPLRQQEKTGESVRPGYDASWVCWKGVMEEREAFFRGQ